ncbi:permease [Bdellovibrionota bacterium FG-1]
MPNRHSLPVKQLLAAVVALVAWVVLYENLARISHWLTYQVLHLPVGRLAAAIEFFVFEAPKVLLLLTVVVFCMGIIRSFFSPERTRAILAGRKESVGNVLAALLGIVTPFCSCSAVPLFIGFVTAGVPLGVTFSFLVSAPMVNEVALVLLFGMFGWRVALIYLGTGLLVAILSGWVIGRLKLERYVEEWVYRTQAPTVAGVADVSTWITRLDYGLSEVREIVGKVWIYVLLGIAVGAGIHGYVPEDFMASLMGKESWWSVPLAVIVGVPMYSNAAGIIPIVKALLEKGAALGTVLAFMMSVIALSLPETIMMKNPAKRVAAKPTKTRLLKVENSFTASISLCQIGCFYCNSPAIT